MRSSRVNPYESRKSGTSEPRHSIHSDAMSYGDTVSSVGSSSYEYVRASHRNGKMVMETVKSIVPTLSRNDESRDSILIMMKRSTKRCSLQSRKLHYVGLLELSSLRSSFLPSVTLPARKFIKRRPFKINSENNNFKSLSIFEKPLLQFLAFLFYFTKDAFDSLLLLRFGVAIGVILILPYHLVTTYSYETYSRTVWAIAVFFIIITSLGSYESEEPVVGVTILLLLPVTSVSLRTDYSVTVRIQRLYILILVIIVTFKNQSLIVTRQVPILLLYAYSSGKLAYSTEKSDRVRYLNSKKLTYCEQRLEEEKQKTIQIIKRLYPRRIAADLSRDTVESLKNYVSCKVIIMAVYSAWTDHRSPPSIEILEEINKVIEGAFSRYSIDKVKQSGDHTLGCIGMFEEIDEKMFIGAIDCACQIVSWVQSFPARFQTNISIGISFGPAVCVNIHCQRSAVDIFGTCVDEAFKLSMVAPNHKDAIFASDAFVQASQTTKQRIQDLPGQPLAHRVIQPTASHRLRQKAEESGDGDSDSAVVAPHTKLHVTSNWQLSLNREPQMFVVGQDKHDEMMSDHKQEIPCDDLNDLDEMLHGESSKNSFVSLLQTSCYVLIYAISGWSDIWIFEEHESVSFTDGGQAIFVRMIVLLPIIISLYLALVYSTSNHQWHFARKWHCSFTFLIYFFCYLYTVWGRYVTFTNYFFRWESMSIIIAQSNEAYLYMDGVFSNVALSSMHYNIVNRVDFVCYTTIYLIYQSISWWLPNGVMIYCVFLLPVWILLWRLGSIKSEISRKELQSHISHIEKMNEIKEQTDHAERCLQSVISESFLEIFRGGEYKENQLVSATIVVIKFVEMDRLSAGLSVDQFKRLVTEIYEEVENLTVLCEGDPVKSFGSYYKVAFGVHTQVAEDEKSTTTKALQFCQQVQDHFRELSCAESHRRVAVSIGVSAGICTRGVSSTSRLSFDVWGVAVNQAHIAADICSPGQTLVDQSVLKRWPGNLISYNFQAHPSEKAFHSYIHVENVWARFITAIDWDTDGILNDESGSMKTTSTISDQS